MSGFAQSQADGFRCVNRAGVACRFSRQQPSVFRYLSCTAQLWKRLSHPRSL